MIFYLLLVLFFPVVMPMMIFYLLLVCLMPPIKTCDTSMPIFFQYWTRCVSCFHGCHEPFNKHNMRLTAIVFMLFIHFFLSFEGTMPWYVVYRGRNPGVYEQWVQCHQQVTGFHNSCYKSFTCRDEAIASYLEFTGQSKVHIVGDGLQLINNTFSLQIIVVVQFLIILGLLIMIISSMSK
jgi:hypothetical protein